MLRLVYVNQTKWAGEFTGEVCMSDAHNSYMCNLENIKLEYITEAHNNTMTSGPTIIAFR